MTEAEARTVERCESSPTEMELLRTQLDYHECRAKTLERNLEAVRDALVSLRRMYGAACDRIAAQSELLSSAAERKEGTP